MTALSIKYLTQYFFHKQLSIFLLIALRVASIAVSLNSHYSLHKSKYLQWGKVTKCRRTTFSRNFINAPVRCDAPRSTALCAQEVDDYGTSANTFQPDSRRTFLASLFMSSLSVTQKVDPVLALGGLVKFPCKNLGNIYHVMRAGQSLYEEENVLITNPLFLTNREAALSQLGRSQVVDACKKLKENDIIITVVKYSLAASAIDSSNIVGDELKVGGNKIIPEFTFMDPRAVGGWDMSTLNVTEPAVWAMDADEAGALGTGAKPPPNEDGTPNETLQTQFIRLRQLMSILETQYSGDNILLIFPDGGTPALLTAAIGGIPFNRVHELEFSPGEVRLNVTMESALKQLSEQPSREYLDTLERGRLELQDLREDPERVVNVKDLKYEEESRVEQLKEEEKRAVAEEEALRRKKEIEERKQLELERRKASMEIEKQRRKEIEERKQQEMERKKQQRRDQIDIIAQQKAEREERRRRREETALLKEQGREFDKEERRKRVSDALAKQKVELVDREEEKEDWLVTGCLALGVVTAIGATAMNNEDDEIDSPAVSSLEMVDDVLNSKSLSTTNDNATNISTGNEDYKLISTKLPNTPSTNASHNATCGNVAEVEEFILDSNKEGAVTELNDDLEFPESIESNSNRLSVKFARGSTNSTIQGIGDEKNDQHEPLLQIPQNPDSNTSSNGVPDVIIEKIQGEREMQKDLPAANYNISSSNEDDGDGTGINAVEDSNDFEVKPDAIKDKLNSTEAATKAMEDYMDQDDGAEAWLDMIMDLTKE